MTTCEGCGFDYGSVRPAELPGALTETAHRFQTALLDADVDELRRRPDGQTWSPLEYACHIRDVLLVQRERVLQARRVVMPEPAPMGRDERVDHDGYGEQLPGDVARQMEDAALLFANVLDRLGPVDWQRTLVYRFPERAERSLRWVAVHTVHELAHHVGDMRRAPGPSSVLGS